MKEDPERRKRVAAVINRVPHVSTDARLAKMIGLGKVELSKWKNEGAKIPKHKEKRFFEITQIEPDWLDLPLNELENTLSKHPFRNHPIAWNPPRTPKPFIGRTQEIQTIKSKLGVFLEPNTYQSNILSIHGIPGVGKSTIAAWLVNDPEILTVFSHAVLWSTFGQLNGDGNTIDFEIRNKLIIWGRLLGDDNLNQGMTLKEVSKRFENLVQHQSALLICDDVWDSDHVLPIRRLADRGVRLMITSRFPDIAHKVAQDSISVLELKGFNESDAISLLTKITPDVVEKHRDEAKKLMKDLDYIPLAINVAGHLLRRELMAGLDVVSMINELRNEGERLLQESIPLDMVELIREAKSPTVAAWLKRSVSVLDEDTRQCFISLGAMAEKPATFGFRVLKLRWGEKTETTIRKLVDCGLVQATSDKRYQMHALLATLARTMGTPTS